MENKKMLDEEKLSEVAGGVVDITKIDPSFLTYEDELTIKGVCVKYKSLNWSFAKVYSYAIEKVLPGIQMKHNERGIFPVSEEYFKFRFEQVWVESGGSL